MISSRDNLSLCWTLDHQEIFSFSLFDTMSETLQSDTEIFITPANLSGEISFALGKMSGRIVFEATGVHTLFASSFFSTAALRSPNCYLGPRPLNPSIEFYWGIKVSPYSWRGIVGGRGNPLPIKYLRHAVGGKRERSLSPKLIEER